MQVLLVASASASLSPFLSPLGGGGGDEKKPSMASRTSLAGSGADRRAGFSSLRMAPRSLRFRAMKETRPLPSMLMQRDVS